MIHTIAPMKAEDLDLLVDILSEDSWDEVDYRNENTLFSLDLLDNLSTTSSSVSMTVYSSSVEEETVSPDAVSDAQKLSPNGTVSPNSNSKSSSNSILHKPRNNSILHKPPVRAIKSLSTFVQKLHHYRSVGDFHKIYRLVKLCVVQGTIITIKYSTGHTQELHGSDQLIPHCKDLLDLFPDLISNITLNTCFRNKRSAVKVIKVKTTLTGTPVGDTVLPSFLYPAQRVIDASGYPVSINFAETMKLYLDESTNKIGKIDIDYSIYEIC